MSTYVNRTALVDIEVQLAFNIPLMHSKGRKRRRRRRRRKVKKKNKRGRSHTQTKETAINSNHFSLSGEIFRPFVCLSLQFPTQSICEEGIFHLSPPSSLLSLSLLFLSPFLYFLNCFPSPFFWILFPLLLFTIYTILPFFYFS